MKKIQLFIKFLLIYCRNNEISIKLQEFLLIIIKLSDFLSSCI